jgi:glycosyltransferase involved in cell wall biosynthesis
MFSVVIPVYNHRKFLREAVVSALRSSLVKEILIVDDGSSDGSIDQIRALQALDRVRVRDLSEQEPRNYGAHYRLNQLVKEARNDWVAVLNSDDAFVAGRFETIAARCRGSDVDFIWGQLLIIDAEGSPIGMKRGLLEPEYLLPAKLAAATWQEEKLSDILASQNCIASTSNMVFKRSLHERIGGFVKLRYCHDWAFALWAGVVGKPLYLSHFLSAYRVHNNNTISDNRALSAPEVKVIFSQFKNQFPEFAARQRFQEWLATNKYLC